MVKNFIATVTEIIIPRFYVSSSYPQEKLTGDNQQSNCSEAPFRIPGKIPKMESFLSKYEAHIYHKRTLSWRFFLEILQNYMVLLFVEHLKMVYPISVPSYKPYSLGRNEKILV